ncbi:hypothetical protein U8Y98_21700 [Priestia megaterium]|uniref:hypothetical protein n=1 Tax=Priestia megaterium TaxID=1404 RepID=UPI002FE3ED32
MTQQRSITGFSKKEMIERTKIKHNTVFNRRYNKVVEFYGLVTKETNPFKELVDDEDSKFEFPLEIVQPLSALLRSIEANPFFRKNADEKKIDADKIIDFYQNLIEEIELFPDYEKYIIKEHPVYINTIKEIDIIPKLSKKISQTIVALENITKQERADIMIEVYKKLDEWIFNAYLNNSYLKRASSNNLEKLKEYIPNIINDTTITQDSIKSLDNLIAERIKMWTGLIGKETEINKNVIESKKRKRKLEKYIKDVDNKASMTTEDFRYFMEEMHLEELFDRQFKTHRQDIDELIDHLKKSNYENKIASVIADKKVEHWKNSDEHQQKKYVDTWKQHRIKSLKEHLKAYEETIKVLEEDDEYSLKKVQEEMLQLEEYLNFNKNIENTKDYEDISNLFLGQLLVQKLEI